MSRTGDGATPRNGHIKYDDSFNNRGTGVTKTSPEHAWYCVRSQNKHEHIAAAHLRMLEGVTVFSPRIRFKRATRRGVVWVTEGMFPGYLFARFGLSEMHLQVRYAHGVIGIIRFGDRYSTIEEGALAPLWSHTDFSDVMELNYELSQGDRVNITGAPSSDWKP